jgi:hypothetical protein
MSSFARHIFIVFGLRGWMIGKDVFCIGIEESFGIGMTMRWLGTWGSTSRRERWLRLGIGREMLL